MILEVLFVISIMVLYMIGGQIEKGCRRFGVPSMAVICAYTRSKKSVAEKTRYIGFLLLMFALSIGYGESSKLRKALGGNDKLTRLVYACILATVFGITGGNIGFCFPILAVAFQVRAGSLFHIGKYDVLIEDICRSFAIAICVLLTIKGV